MTGRATALADAPRAVEAAGGLPAQVTSTGGSALVSLAAVLAFFVAVGLAVAVTYRFAAGYRRTRRRPLLLLAAGLFLLAPAPMFVRLVLGNVGGVSWPARSLVVTVSKLCGLLVVLYVVYEP